MRLEVKRRFEVVAVHQLAMRHENRPDRGSNYQTLINDALCEYIQGARLETVVRQAVRDEVKAARTALAKTA